MLQSKFPQTRFDEHKSPGIFSRRFNSIQNPRDRERKKKKKKQKGQKRKKKNTLTRKNQYTSNVTRSPGFRQRANPQKRACFSNPWLPRLTSTARQPFLPKPSAAFVACNHILTRWGKADSRTWDQGFDRGPSIETRRTGYVKRGTRKHVKQEVSVRKGRRERETERERERVGYWRLDSLAPAA